MRLHLIVHQLEELDFDNVFDLLLLDASGLSDGALEVDGGPQLPELKELQHLLEKQLLRDGEPLNVGHGNIVHYIFKVVENANRSEQRGVVDVLLLELYEVAVLLLKGLEIAFGNHFFNMVAPHIADIFEELLDLADFLDEKFVRADSPIFGFGEKELYERDQFLAFLFPIVIQLLGPFLKIVPPLVIVVESLSCLAVGVAFVETFASTFDAECDLVVFRALHVVALIHLFDSLADSRWTVADLQFLHLEKSGLHSKDVPELLAWRRLLCWLHY